MELSHASMRTSRDDRLVVAFPGNAEPLASRAQSEPLAALSLASRGDMKFGDPSLVANRELFLRSLGIEPGSSRGLRLAHSRNVLFPEATDDVASLAAASGGADGLVVRDRSLAPTVTVADCMPIWLLDRDSGAFGLLHSGWKGTGILRVAVLELRRRFGSRPSAMAAVLGPAIGACCYAVPEERAVSFAAEFGESAVARRGGEAFLDLRAANIGLAEGLGLGHLLSIDACTCCDPRLGSYRRQGKDSFTRMLAVCGFFEAATDLGGT
jgi:polyphenol oxidase